MTPESLFSISGALVFPGWLLLIFLPRWKWTTRLIAAVLIPGILGLLYVYLVVTHFFGAEGGFGSLADAALLFKDPWVLLAGWIHYLAFDLFIGAWEVRDAQRVGVHHLLVVPCLLMTFMFGPAGLLLYLILRGGIRRRLTIDEDAA